MEEVVGWKEQKRADKPREAQLPLIVVQKIGDADWVFIAWRCHRFDAVFWGRRKGWHGIG